MQHDDAIRAAQELANRVKNPEAAEGLPNTTEEHADYVLELIESAPKPPTPEQAEAIAQAEQLKAERASLTVTAQINETTPDAEQLADLDRKIEIAEQIAAGA